MGFEHAKVLQDYQTMAVLLSQVFGGKKNDNAVKPKSFDELQAAFNSVVGKKG